MTSPDDPDQGMIVDPDNSWGAIGPDSQLYTRLKFLPIKPGQPAPTPTELEAQGITVWALSDSIKFE